MMSTSEIKTIGDLWDEFRRIEIDLNEKFKFDGLPDIAINSPGTLSKMRQYELMEEQRIKHFNTLRQQESVRRFDLLCTAHEDPFDWNTLVKFRAQLCINSGKSEKEVDGLTIEEFVAEIGRHEGRQEPSISSAERHTRAKRSTEKGEARLKIIAALTMHHRYADGGCLNTEPVSVAGLARIAEVAKATTSGFFKNEFNGHSEYKRLCVADIKGLATKINKLNGDSRPREHFKSADVTILGEQDDQTDEFGDDDTNDFSDDYARDSRADNDYARNFAHDDGDFGDDDNFGDVYQND